MKKSGASQGQSASELISKRIAELGDWRGETLSRMRKLIKEADAEVVEEWKWMGTGLIVLKNANRVVTSSARVGPIDRGYFFGGYGVPSRCL
jgi:hypothetical protein